MSIEHFRQTGSVAYNSVIQNEILEAFGTWIERHVKDGWDAYFLSFMFNQLPGSSQAQIRQMHDEITTFYRKLITRVERAPALNKNAHKLPRGVFFPDVPAYKRRKQHFREVSVNDGLHMHGLVVIPKKSRLKVGLGEHVQEYWTKMYHTQKMYRIDVARTDSRVVYATDYAGKALKTPRFDQDDVLILPKAISELESGRRVAVSEARKIRDIQSRYNVSDEVAQDIASNRRFRETK